jgi:hypothetical protein
MKYAVDEGKQGWGSLSVRSTAVPTFPNGYNFATFLLEFIEGKLNKAGCRIEFTEIEDDTLDWMHGISFTMTLDGKEI